MDTTTYLFSLGILSLNIYIFLCIFIIFNQKVTNKQTKRKKNVEPEGLLGIVFF